MHNDDQDVGCVGSIVDEGEILQLEKFALDKFIKLYPKFLIEEVPFIFEDCSSRIDSLFESIFNEEYGIDKGLPIVDSEGYMIGYQELGCPVIPFAIYNYLHTIPYLYLPKKKILLYLPSNHNDYFDKNAINPTIKRLE